MTRRALDGIRVIELADEHGEWCGKLLADMGADVVKVEPPGGARSRGIGPVHRRRARTANGASSSGATTPASAA